MSILNQQFSSSAAFNRHVKPVASNLAEKQSSQTNSNVFAPKRFSGFSQLEKALSEIESIDDVFLFIANEIRALSKAGQIYVFSYAIHTRIEAISSLPRVNRQSPLVQDLEQTIGFLANNQELDLPKQFFIADEYDSPTPALAKLPFKKLLWVPLNNTTGKLCGGILFARNETWNQNETAVMEDIAKKCSVRLNTISKRSRFTQLPNFRFTSTKKLLIAAILVIIMSLFAPVAMSVNAPFQVVSRQSVIIAASMEGVIEDILVEPGEIVFEGQQLVRFVDTVYKNLVSIAQEEYSLSQAKLKQASQLSFESKEGRRELGLSQADLALKKAELKLAEDQSSRTIISASSSGVAMYSDKQSMLGKPVKIGERVLEIADPEVVEISIELDVADSIALSIGSEVKLFMDSDPLNSRSATVTHLNYQAEIVSSGDLAYKLTAEITDDFDFVPQLGVRGTAKIYGANVPLAFYFFRRPITVIRQWIGI